MRCEGVLQSLGVLRFICLTGRRSKFRGPDDLGKVRYSADPCAAGCNLIKPSHVGERDSKGRLPGPDRSRSVEHSDMCFGLGPSVMSSPDLFLLPGPAMSCGSTISGYEWMRFAAEN